MRELLLGQLFQGLQQVGLGDIGQVLHHFPVQIRMFAEGLPVFPVEQVAVQHLLGVFKGFLAVRAQAALVFDQPGGKKPQAVLVGLGGGEEVVAPVGDGADVLPPDNVLDFLEEPLGIFENIEAEIPAPVVRVDDLLFDD